MITINIIKNLVDKKSFYNSESHLVKTIEAYLGYSHFKVREIIKEYKEKGMYSFENNQVNWKFEEEVIAERLPDYILATKKISDSRYWLKEKDFRILCFLADKRNKLTHVYEQGGLGGASNILYLCADSIAKGTGYTIDQVRYSLKKLNLYFENFWSDPSKEARKQRYHKYSLSKSIKLPNRILWKQLIEDKVLEMTGLNIGDLVLPVLIDEEKKKVVDRSNGNITILEYSRILTHNKKQKCLLEDGKRKLQELRNLFRRFVLDAERSGEEKEDRLQDLTRLNEELESYEKDPGCVFRWIRKLMVNYPYLRLKNNLSNCW